MKVIDIAIFILKKTTFISEEEKKHFINYYEGLKNEIIDVEPRFKNLTSIKYLSQELFSYFQESSGDHINSFWEEILKNKLPFERENKLVKIIKRKKIRNEIEYEYIIDTLGFYIENGLLNDGEIDIINSLIIKFENNSSARS
ncbi:hypothetical protein [Aureivirga sp. CE67]|uniref:hypothetical protein n=1 Tax=Aureivirga sp. CE67 TaxID=1788983 RepID=UPI0018CBCAD7|nr:hypothetical protein [Aureivirga sp. CE67]